MNETDQMSSTEAFFNILIVGCLVVILFAGVFYLITKAMRSVADSRVEAYRPLAEPLYTDSVTGRTKIAPGWYPTPVGDQDRYHDGTDWTENYRTHSEENRVGDAAPDANEDAVPVADQRLSDEGLTAQDLEAEDLSTGVDDAGSGESRD